jgi:hypothetical protein
MVNPEYFLSRLVGDKNFRNLLISINDDITEPIYSYMADNSNIKSREQILQFISTNTDKLKAFIPPEVPNNPSVAKNQFGPSLQPVPMVGEIVQIEATHENYTSLLQHAQQNRWIYRGITILEKKITDDSGKEKLVWDLFFF